jgi:hypothetical protein
LRKGLPVGENQQDTVHDEEPPINPAARRRRTSPYSPESDKAIILSLAIYAIFSAAAITLLASLGKNVSEALIATGSAAVGALAMRARGGS